MLFRASSVQQFGDRHSPSRPCGAALLHLSPLLQAEGWAVALPAGSWVTAAAQGPADSQADQSPKMDSRTGTPGSLKLLAQEDTRAHNLPRTTLPQAGGGGEEGPGLPLQSHHACCVATPIHAGASCWVLAVRPTASPTDLVTELMWPQRRPLGHSQDPGWRTLTQSCFLLLTVLSLKKSR